MRYFFVLLLIVIMPYRAFAACTAPAGVAGTMDYFGAPDNTFKFCNGTAWVDMAGGGGIAPLVVSSGTTSIPASSYATIVSGLEKTGYYQVYMAPAWNTAICGYVYPTFGTDSNKNISITLWNNATCGGAVNWKIVRID